MDDVSVGADLDIIDFRRGLTAAQREKLRVVDVVSNELIGEAMRAFARSDGEGRSGREAIKYEDGMDGTEDCMVYEHRDFDGSFPVFVFPSIFNYP